MLGVGSYQTRPLPNALNNAGLVAQTLRDLGFSTTEGADLPQAEMRAAIANFIALARQAGPDAVVLVYIAGLGLQHDSDSYLLPSDAVIDRESDVPIAGLRLADLSRALGSVPGKVRVLLLDVSAQHPWIAIGQPVRAGIGVIDAGSGLLVASAVAPGEVAAPFDGAYGRFALALSEQLRAPGLPLDEAMVRVRLRVHQQSNGRDTPWETSRLAPPVRALALPVEPAADASPPPPRAERRTEGLPVEEAYALAIERDSIAGYQSFLRSYPDSIFTRRVQRLLAARRETLVWNQTVRAGSPPAYWTYLRRYPRGPHTEEARLRLARAQAPVTPAQGFIEIVYQDIPEPLPVIEIVDDPDFWAPAPAAFYDRQMLEAPVVLGPPPAQIWALPPPPAYVWGTLPVAAAAAAIVTRRFVLPRTLRQPVAPVVLRPSSGPRPVIRPGLPGSAPAQAGIGGGQRPLPGAPGGQQLPRPGTTGPALPTRPSGPIVGHAGRPGEVRPNQADRLPGTRPPKPGRPGIERPVGQRPGRLERPLLHRPGPPRPPSYVRPQQGRPAMGRPAMQRPVMQRPIMQRPVMQRPVIARPMPSRPAFHGGGGGGRPFQGRRR
ncbi:Caspase domain protein [bacterium YEK0313]|nr:Caspase domain protein [bacterium YEK0313]